jgi:hypothetical protein
LWGSCYLIISFMCMFCRSLCCLFFFDLRIMITPLVSSNSSCNKLNILPLFVYMASYTGRKCWHKIVLF